MRYANRVVRRSMTEEQAERLLMRVANPDDWRKPICRTLVVESEQEIQDIVKAIDLLAGGGCFVARYKRRSGGISATFRAPGHYALVNRSDITPEERERYAKGGFIRTVSHVVDVDVDSKVITLKCVRCGTLSLLRSPGYSDKQMHQLMAQMMSGATSRIHQCQTCNDDSDKTPC